MIISIQTLHSASHSFWACTAMSLLGIVATIFSLLDLGIICQSSLLILSSFVRLDGKRWWTATFRAIQRCLIESSQASGWARQQWSLLCYFSCMLRVAVLLKGEPSESEVFGTLKRFSFRTSLIFLSPETSHPLPAAEKPMMLPPPCFTEGIELGR